MLSIGTHNVGVKHCLEKSVATLLILKKRFSLEQIHGFKDHQLILKRNICLIIVVYLNAMTASKSHHVMQMRQTPDIYFTNIMNKDVKTSLH